MSYKYFLLFVLACNISNAQLSIRNSAYVFVSDEIVFVEDDINLNEINSSIYLRNEAQIIQGSGITGNSGVGQLSVYQEANVDEYEYNYWCAPIGNKTSNSSNNPFGISLLNDVTGLITATPATYTRTSSYNGTSSPLNIEPYWIWKYIASSNYSDWIHVQGSTTINPGEGFTMKGTTGSGGAQRYDFRGKPNTGTISVSVLNNQYTLVGNPYPSALDALAYIHDTENASVINGTLYYWEQNPNVNSHYLAAYDGGYGTYTISADGSLETYVTAIFSTYNNDGTVNALTGTTTSGKIPRRYIPIGQGFMVMGTATGTVKAKNSHRYFVKETASNSEFFKNSNSKTDDNTIKYKNGYAVVPDDYERFRLNVNFNNTYTRQLVETFHTSATLSFDYGLESKLIASELLASDAYLSNNSTMYIAEAQAYKEDLKIPFTLKLSQDMPIKISIADIQNFNDDHPIYIHDIENDTYVNLKSQDFNCNLEANEYIGRFEITFTKSTPELSTTIDIIEIEEIKIIQNNQIAELKILNLNDKEVKTINLYDISGKLLLSKKISESLDTFTYSTKSLSDGVYVTKIISDNDKLITKKIVINNKK